MLHPVLTAAATIHARQPGGAQATQRDLLARGRRRRRAQLRRIRTHIRIRRRRRRRRCVLVDQVAHARQQRMQSRERDALGRRGLGSGLAERSGGLAARNRASVARRRRTPRAAGLRERARGRLGGVAGTAPLGVGGDHRVHQPGLCAAPPLRLAHVLGRVLRFAYP